MRRGATGAIPLIVLMGALSWWDLTYALFWAGAPAPNPSFWLDITYVGVVIVPTAYLAFALQLARMDRWLTRATVLALAIEPLLVLLLMATDSWHGLFFAGQRELNTGMILYAGPMFWVNVIYSQLLILVASLLLARTFVRSSGLYRKQIGLVLIAAVIPWINTTIFALGLSPLRNADNTPFSFTIAALLFAFALVHYRLLDIVPVARDVLIENMSDGVMVLDVQSRVVDLNAAARRVLAPSADSPIGRLVTDVLPSWPLFGSPARDRAERELEIVPGPDGRYLNVRVTPLVDRRQTLIGQLVVWRDMTELKRAQEDLHKLATTDTLTPALNRRHFLELATTELRRAARFNKPFSIVLVDIDHFKAVNDTYGHLVGDKVLIAFVSICQANIRDVDIFARFGGEEFVWLLPESGADRACQAAERLRRIIAQSPLEVATDIRLQITTSLGVATWTGPKDSLDTMLNRADQALYEAKASGRNRAMVG